MCNFRKKLLRNLQRVRQIEEYSGCPAQKNLVNRKFSLILLRINMKLKLKFSRYRPGYAQRVGRGIALLFHDCGTRRG